MTLKDLYFYGNFKTSNSNCERYQYSVTQHKHSHAIKSNTFNKSLVQIKNKQEIKI